jgi:hypothetical protein
MTASYNKFNVFVETLGKKTDNLASSGDVIKVALATVQPTAAMATIGTITQLASASGYITGGGTATVQNWTQTAGTLKWVVSSPSTWTCTTAAMSAFQWVVIHDSTTANLIGWWDYGTSCTLQVADTFAVTLDAANGVLQIV